MVEQRALAFLYSLLLEVSAALFLALAVIRC